MASLSLRETLLNCDYDYRYIHKRFLQLYASCSTFWIVDVLHVRFGLSTLTVRDSFLAYPYAASCRYVYVTAMYLLSPSVLDTQGEFPRQVLRATIHDTQINFCQSAAVHIRS